MARFNRHSWRERESNPSLPPRSRDFKAMDVLISRSEIIEYVDRSSSTTQQQDRNDLVVLESFESTFVEPAANPRRSSSRDL